MWHFLVLSALILSGVAKSKVYVTPDFAHVSSSLDLSGFKNGLEQAKSSIVKFEKILESKSLSNETKEFLEVVISSGNNHVAYVENIFTRTQSHSKRNKRDVSPLNIVGDIIDWSFGLVSNDHLEQFKGKVETALSKVSGENEKLHGAILSNSKALNESIQNLQKFETFMNLLVDANDGLLRNERFLLKIVRLKFELDTCLRSLENYATIFQEVVDRSSIGYPSHFMFTQEFLTSNLFELNDKYPELSTLYTSKDVQQFFKLPLALSSFNTSHVSSLMRIPMAHADSTFNHNSEKYFDGFVVLSNLYYKIFLTFPQFDNCIGDSRHIESVCFLRPCLVRTEEMEFKCYALSNTDFLISSSNSKIHAFCNDALTELSSDQADDFLHISVPKNCQVTSKHFVIKKINTFKTYQTEVASLNKIYKVESGKIVLEKKDSLGLTKHIKLSVPSKAIIAQLNKTRKGLNGLKESSTIKIPTHFEPLSYFGTSVGSFAFIVILILLIVVCKNI